MKLTKLLGYLGLVASILVGLGEYFLHYSTSILEHSEDYAFFNPIVILILLVVLGTLIPSIGKHMLPILMNVTHFILFTLSLYQLNTYTKNHQNA